MSNEPSMENNFVIVEPARRNNSSVDIGGYSLLPDIIWNPDTELPEMLNSQFGKIIFTNVKDSYTTNEDLLCTYSIMAGVDIRDGDRVAIFYVGWTDVKDVITWVPAAKHPWPNEELSVVFPASQLPASGTHFYQFCYLSAGEVRGASIPFNFIKERSTDEEQKVLPVKNCGLIDASLHKNLVTSGEVCHESVNTDLSHNATVASHECSEAGRETQPGASSQQHMEVSTTAAEPCCSQGVSQEDIAELTELNNDLQDEHSEMEEENEIILRTMDAIKEENERLRSLLNYELQKNKALIETLQKTDSVRQRLIQNFDLKEQCNSVVLAQMENELENQVLRNRELFGVINDKNRTIVHLNQRLHGIAGHASAPEEVPQLPSYPPQRDSQQENSDIEAISDIQVQNPETQDPLPSFRAVLRKTRNYYTTFLMDKSEIERKVYALNSARLTVLQKLHVMKNRKESLIRIVSQYYSELRCVFGVQSDESIKIMQEISKVGAEQKALDEKAQREVRMLNLIKKQQGINRKNTYALRAKAVEVFSKFLESFNSSDETYSDAARAEMNHLSELYSALDEKFNDILDQISLAVRYTYVWD